MDIIKKHYPTHLKLTLTQQPFTHALKQELFTELKDKTFILRELETLLTQTHYKQIKYENLVLNILPSKQISYKHIQTVFKRLITLIRIYQLQQPIQVWFIPIAFKRYFPQNGEYVDAKHINGGYTYIANHTIYIYRFEEFPKVMLHEILHNSCLQVNWSHSQLQRLYTALNLNPKTQLQPSEAIIELWALYYQLLFIAYETKKPFQALYSSELKWSLFQTRRLLDYSRQVCNGIWLEYTHSYSYIYLKTCLLYFWKDFSLLQPPYTDKRVTDFLLNKLNDSNFKAAIADARRYKTNSFRMTRYGHL